MVAHIVSHRGERETWLTGEEAQGLFSPSPLPLRANLNRARDVWVWGKGLIDIEHFHRDHVAFFVTLFKGYRCNELNEITMKKSFLWEPEKINLKSTGIGKTQVKSSCARFHFVNALEVFLLSDSNNTHENLFFGVISFSSLHLQPLKSVKRMQCGLGKNVQYRSNSALRKEIKITQFPNGFRLKTKHD